MTNNALLAIDVGTQSVRAIAFDPQGEILGRSQIHIEPYFSEYPGWAEQDPELYWDSIVEACQQLWQSTAVKPEQIAGLSLTTQRATMVCADEEGKALRPAIVWLDQRRAEGMPPVSGMWGFLFKLAGVSETVASFQAEADANWLSQNQPELWQKTSKFLFLSGFLLKRLTGEFVDSVGSQVGYVPFDYKNLEWAKAKDWKWQAVTVQRDQLPQLKQPGSVLGTLTDSAATAMGLPQGMRVIASAADKACEVLGSGCAGPETACLSFGTTATINTSTAKYVEVTKHIPPYPAALPRHFNTEIQIYRGFWMVSWFKKEFAQHEQRLAEQRGIAPEALFDELIRDIPPGSMGLTLQPYWSPGVREPGPEAKGSIIGFGDVHTRAHIYRAILEGLAYALRDGRERTEKRTGVPIRQLRIAGGGSQSDIAMQLTADIFNLRSERPHVYETSALGAAINCAVALGFHADYHQAVSEMTRVGKVFEPDPKAVATYDALYKRVYQRMYKQLRPLYQDIRTITGYPA